VSTPLEEAARAVAAEMHIPADAPMTEEQAAEFRERFAEMAGRYHLTIPPRPSLTEDEVRQLLRECVTVVKPGETLVIRGDRDWTPNQMREVQDMLDGAVKWRELGFTVLVVPGEELGVAEAAEVTHLCGPSDGPSVFSCCGRTPFEVPRSDRVTLDPALVTCGKAADDA
jgi:hypothetical protein